jgi:hypothetical protein
LGRLAQLAAGTEPPHSFDVFAGAHPLDSSVPSSSCASPEFRGARAAAAAAGAAAAAAAAAEVARVAPSEQESAALPPGWPEHTGGGGPVSSGATTSTNGQLLRGVSLMQWVPGGAGMAPHSLQLSQQPQQQQQQQQLGQEEQQDRGQGRQGGEQPRVLDRLGSSAGTDTGSSIAPAPPRTAARHRRALSVEAGGWGGFAIERPLVLLCSGGCALFRAPRSFFRSRFATTLLAFAPRPPPHKHAAGFTSGVATHEVAPGVFVSLQRPQRGGTGPELRRVRFDKQARVHRVGLGRNSPGQAVEKPPSTHFPLQRRCFQLKRRKRGGLSTRRRCCSAMACSALAAASSGRPPRPRLQQPLPAAAAAAAVPAPAGPGSHLLA